jgi:hypothetical protein
MVIMLLIIPGIFKPNQAQRHFSIEVLPGGSAIFPSTLFIHQEGFSDLKFKAHYRTNSFVLPIYYSYRAGYKISDKAIIEIEMNHLKVILDNKPPEIEEFSVSHGFNQLWFNYALIYKQLVFRTGIGPVIAHPESLIRGKRLETHKGIANKGYYLSGITAQLAVQKKIFIGKHFYFSAETKLNTAYAKVNIAEGYARFPIFAWNGLIGVGTIF